MIDFLRRTWRMISNGARPIDWLVLAVDFLVLIAILYFEVIEIRHKRKMRKRVVSLFPFMERGQELQRNVPDPRSHANPTDKIEEWTNDVQAWSKETRSVLAECSPRAAAAFALIAETGVFANPQTIHTESGRSFPIEGPLRESYQALVTQLKNLRSIMEKPEAYFIDPAVASDGEGGSSS